MPSPRDACRRRRGNFAAGPPPVLISRSAAPAAILLGSEFEIARRRSSFETRPPGAPQDEDKYSMSLRKSLILRSPRSGRLEGRKTPGYGGSGGAALRN